MDRKHGPFAKWNIRESEKDGYSHTIRTAIFVSAQELFGKEALDSFPIQLHPPAKALHGDIATNIAFLLGKKLKQPPLLISEKISKELEKQLDKRNKGFLSALVKRIESAGGFINFWLHPDFLIKEARMLAVITISAKKPILATGLPLDKKKIVVEFAHPNTHKEFHIGHLRNITTGESVVRLLESVGADVFRANYEGDVGLHVAKAIWGVYKLINKGSNPSDLSTPSSPASLSDLTHATKNMTPSQKAKFLGEGYALGSHAYEENETAKNEIIEVNKSIYKNPQEVLLWKETRQMSLDYFDSVYKRLGTHFDRLFFESEVEEKGRQLVIEGVEKGIFKKDKDGSIYFPGERIGLNNCVFVTRKGYATYEGKDVALEHVEYEVFPYDVNIHVVANEQTNFFQIAFAALEQLFLYQKGRQYHLSYGMVNLTSGKMSSRTGQVITADWLIDEAKKKITSLYPGNSPQKISRVIEDATAETVAIAAVKYSMLRVNPKQDIAFDINSSVALDGDSGPYLLYTYARCRSVMRKARYHSVPGDAGDVLSAYSPKSLKLPKLLKPEINPEELAVLRLLYRFPQIVREAALTVSPNVLCTFLYDLAQTYNAFYNKHQILQSSVISSQKSVIGNQNSVISNQLTENRQLKTDNSQPTTYNLPARNASHNDAGGQLTTAFRLLLTEATSQVLKYGLYLLGIETVEQM